MPNNNRIVSAMVGGGGVGAVMGGIIEEVPRTGGRSCLGPAKMLTTGKAHRMPISGFG